MDDKTHESPVTEVSVGERKIFLLGTAHISPKSVEDVENLVEEVAPGRMCIEIDASRHKSLTEG
jgi:pheromone shutdown protein TraB